MAEELQAPERFGLCNDEKCSSFFRYLDVSVHTFVDGPDPRDHLANERNLLTWIRTGTTLSLIGFITLVDLPTKKFAPSYSFPWTEEPASTSAKIISYAFIALGFTCLIVSLFNYFRNQRQIIRRLFWVGHGCIGYSVAIITMIFIVFVMVMSLMETH